ncbi:MAG: hypothetical protein R2911_27550 [Caldilineaceae bacterium]
MDIGERHLWSKPYGHIGAFLGIAMRIGKYDYGDVIAFGDYQRGTGAQDILRADI